VAAVFLLHRRYRRTCRICGDTWVLNRGQARPSPGRMRRPRLPGRMGVGGRAMGPLLIGDSVRAFEVVVEQWQAYRRCPTCGIDDFTQAPAR
jgi:hypothetical protein